MIIAEGKTKRVLSVEGNSDLVVIENKDDITKNDDPKQTRVIRGKAEIATKTTSIIFDCLRKEEIPVAYIKRVRNNAFLAEKCRMIPLEVVVRLRPAGSFIKRHPGLEVPDGCLPDRFDTPLLEFFVKTSGGKIVSRDGVQLGSLPIDAETKRPVDDPLVDNPYDMRWRLVHPKKPSSDPDSQLLGRDQLISREDIIPVGVNVRRIREIARRVADILEKIFSQIDLALIDFKIEFGVNSDGEVVVADVIDNDSWRVMTQNGKELSKELFRQGRPIDEVKESYEYVLKRLEQFLFQA